MEKDINKLRKTLIYILDEIDKVCKKNSISYFLVAGTLLGAVRHKGFIPWDDDLDIAMTRDDYVKFEKVCKIEFPKDLYLKNRNTDPGYYLPFGKVCKRGTTYITDIDSEELDSEIFVDVFPLDYEKQEGSLFQTIQGKLVKALKAVIIRKRGIKTKSTSFGVRILELLLLPFSLNYLMFLQEKIMILSNNKKYSYLANLGSNYHYKKQTMPKGFYLPPECILFEGKKYLAPAKTKKYLERLYGNDYMKLPPYEKRITHNIIRLEFGENYEKNNKD